MLNVGYYYYLKSREARNGILGESNGMKQDDEFSLRYGV